jgi:hypothetical protein
MRVPINLASREIVTWEPHVVGRASR